MVFAGVIWVTQCTLVYSQEKKFWVERQRSTQKFRSTEHFRPGGLENSVPNPVDGSPVPTGESRSTQKARSEFSSSSVESLSHHPLLNLPLERSGWRVPSAFISGHGPLLSSLLPGNGDVQSVTYGQKGGPNAPVVIYIQDVHGNSGAQWHIRQTLQALLDRNVVGLVALEGAFGPMDLSRYRAFPDHETVRETADYLLQNDRISGPVHAAFTIPHKIPPFIGIDDPRHYQANVKAYQASARVRDELEKKVWVERRGIAQRKKRLFNKELQKFDQQIKDYHGGSLSLEGVGEVLAAFVSPSCPSPTFQRYRRAVSIERSMDLRRVEKERSQLIAHLHQQLGGEQVPLLVQISLALREGQISPGEFYRSLLDLCQKNSISLKGFPTLADYLHSVRQADQIEGDALLSELDVLENEGYHQMAKTSDEKNLVEESKRLDLVEKLLNFSMTPKEWRDYSVLQKNKELNWSRSGALSSFEDFYREANQRNRFLAENILMEMETLKVHQSVLVAGGHHFPGVSEHLRRAGVTVVCFLPKVDKNDPSLEADPLLIFTRAKTPFEKLFRGDRLFLAPPPLSASVLEGDARVVVLGLEEIKNGPTPLSNAQALSNELTENKIGANTLDVGPGVADVEVAGIRHRVVRRDTGEITVEPLPSPERGSLRFKKFIYSKALPFRKRVRVFFHRPVASAVDSNRKEDPERTNFNGPERPRSDSFERFHEAYGAVNVLCHKLTARENAQTDPIARGLLLAMGDIQRVPPDILEALSIRLVGATGETLCNLTNCLVQAMGKNGFASPDILSALGDRIRSVEVSELMFMAHGLRDGIQKSEWVPQEIREAIEDRLKSRELENPYTRRFLDEAVTLGTFKNEPSSLSPHWEEDEPLHSLFRDQDLSLAKRFQTTPGDLLEDLVRAESPAVFRLFLHSDRSVEILQEKIQRTVHRPVHLNEMIYFLKAASGGGSFLKGSLEGYKNALEAQANQPGDRRYDMNLQMERWAQEGRLLTQDEWAAWGDARRLTELAPYLTEDEYEKTIDIPLTPGKLSRWELVANALKTGRLVWEPRYNQLFSEGVELMGASAMHRFVGRERSPTILEDDNHQSIFEPIEEMMGSLTDQERFQFINNVFAQVSMDQSVDENNRHSRAQFVSLVKGLQGLGFPWKSGLVRGIPGDEMVKAMGDQLIRKGEAFQSWNQFKRIRGLLLFRKHWSLLSSVSSFKDGTETGDRLYQYIVALIMHPGMADFKAVEEWVAALKENTPTFFNRGDVNSMVMHDRIKPSHYFEFPRIDLSPRQLAEGLILGQLDNIQSFKPFTMDYYPSLKIMSHQGKDLIRELLHSGQVDQESLKHALLTVLEKVQLELLLFSAMDEKTKPRVLSSLGAIKNARDWTIRGMKGTLPKAFSNPTLSERLTLERFIAAGLIVPGNRYRMRLLSKSDPLAALTGNEAPSCMGFGTGKNLGYILGPTNGLFAVSKEIAGADGLPRERILATSVVTLDRRIPSHLAEASNLLFERKGRPLSLLDLLGEKFLDRISPESFVGIDNVEASPSVLTKGEGGGFEKIVEEGYARFWTAYLQKYPFTLGERGIDSTFLPVGIVNSDLLTHLQKIKNRFFPQGFNSYSDKTGAEVGVLPLGGVSSFPSSLSLVDRETFIRPLFPEDILEMSYLEEGAGNPLPKDFAGIQNEMIAALSNGAIKGKDREFLGLGLFGFGRLSGFVLAYAGVSPGKDGEEIFVSDFSVQPKKQDSIGSEQLTKALLERIQDHSRYRTLQGKETFLVIDANSAANGFPDLFPRSPEKGGPSSPSEMLVWEKHRADWMAQWGLSFPTEGSAVSDRAALRLKVVPINSPFPLFNKGSLGSIPESLLDPVFKWGGRLLQGRRMAEVAQRWDVARKVWNSSGGAYLETWLIFQIPASIGLGSLVVAALLFPLLHLVVEFLFLDAPGDNSLKAVWRRIFIHLRWRVLFALPFVPLSLGVPVPSIDLFSGFISIDPVLWLVTLVHGAINLMSERNNVSLSGENEEFIPPIDFQKRLIFEKHLAESA